MDVESLLEAKPIFGGAFLIWRRLARSASGLTGLGAKLAVEFGRQLLTARREPVGH